jgi:hypothetical protein
VRPKSTSRSGVRYKKWQGVDVRTTTAMVMAHRRHLQRRLRAALITQICRYQPFHRRPTTVRTTMVSPMAAEATILEALVLMAPRRVSGPWASKVLRTRSRTTNTNLLAQLCVSNPAHSTTWILPLGQSEYSRVSTFEPGSYLPPAS